MNRIITSLAIVSALVMPFVAYSEAIPVRHIQRPMHHLMNARTDDGKTVANGEFTQIAQGNEVTMHLVYRFLDGSIDDETTTYTQQG